MSLRARIIFLIVGSAVIPPLMVLTSVVVGIASGTPVQGAQAFFFVQRLLKGDYDALPTIQTLRDGLEAGRAVPDIYVLDADGVIQYPDERAGELTSVDELVQPADTPRVSTVIPLADERGGTGYLIAVNPNRTLPDRLSLTFISVPILFVLITSVGSVLIIRSLQKSTYSLEMATRRIAEGDLDFKLDPGTGRDRIASLTRSFDQMRVQLKDQLDRSSRFLMGISHDLKTPLASITGYLDAIADGYADDPEKLNRYLGIISKKAQLLESRISALIDYAKQETRDWKKSLESVPLRGFLVEFCSLVEAEAQARGFGFASAIEIPTDTSVLMDPDMVTRALENIVSNAFAYANKGSEIRVDAREYDGAVRITVGNEGPGIGESDLPHVFDPLYRASSSRSGSGFGLGLAVVKAVVTSHGWQIDVDSEPGGHTVFTVTIPDESAGERAVT